MKKFFVILEYVDTCSHQYQIEPVGRGFFEAEDETAAVQAADLHFNLEGKAVQVHKDTNEVYSRDYFYLDVEVHSPDNCLNGG